MFIILIKSLVVVFLVFPSPISKEKLPREFIAYVIGIKDGDTIEVLYNKKPIVIRLEHIDCPEKKQPYGRKAKLFTSKFCFNKEVIIVHKGKFDRYRRLIAEVKLNDKTLNKELVKYGYAFHFKKYSKDTVYNTLENFAKRDKKGVWSQETVITPSIYRSNKKLNKQL